MRMHVIRFIEVPRVDYEKLSDSRLGGTFSQHPGAGRGGAGAAKRTIYGRGEAF